MKNRLSCRLWRLLVLGLTARLDSIGVVGAIAGSATMGLGKVLVKRWKRPVSHIEARYNDSQLDFVDATIVAIAERENITRILTLDRRDFTIIPPQHCSYFDLLP